MTPTNRLRWAVPPHTTTEGPVLQQWCEYDEEEINSQLEHHGNYDEGDWVAVPTEETK